MYGQFAVRFRLLTSGRFLSRLCLPRLSICQHPEKSYLGHRKVTRDSTTWTTLPKIIRIVCCAQRPCGRSTNILTMKQSEDSNISKCWKLTLDHEFCNSKRMHCFGIDDVGIARNHFIQLRRDGRGCVRRMCILLKNSSSVFEQDARPSYATCTISYHLYKMLPNSWFGRYGPT